MMPERTPCEQQGKQSSNPAFYPDENTPCLICSGLVLNIDGDYHICPFASCPANMKFTIFRKGVDMRYITKDEQKFSDQQAKKIKEGESGFFSLNL